MRVVTMRSGRQWIRPPIRLVQCRGEILLPNKNSKLRNVLLSHLVWLLLCITAMCLIFLLVTSSASGKGEAPPPQQYMQPYVTSVAGETKVLTPNVRNLSSETLPSPLLTDAATKLQRGAQASVISPEKVAALSVLVVGGIGLLTFAMYRHIRRRSTSHRTYR